MRVYIPLFKILKVNVPLFKKILKPRIFYSNLLPYIYLNPFLGVLSYTNKRSDTRSIVVNVYEIFLEKYFCCSFEGTSFTFYPMVSFLMYL